MILPTTTHIKNGLVITAGFFSGLCSKSDSIEWFHSALLHLSTSSLFWSSALAFISHRLRSLFQEEGTLSLQLFHFPAQSCGAVELCCETQDVLSWKQTHPAKQREQICSAPGVSCSLLSVLFPLTYCSTLSTLTSCCFHSRDTVWNFIFVFSRPAGTQLLLHKNSHGSAPVPFGITTGTDLLQEAQQHHKICSPSFPFNPTMVCSCCKN